MTFTIYKLIQPIYTKVIQPIYSLHPHNSSGGEECWDDGPHLKEARKK